MRVAAVIIAWIFLFGTAQANPLYESRVGTITSPDRGDLTVTRLFGDGIIAAAPARVQILNEAGALMATTPPLTSFWVWCPRLTDCWVKSGVVFASSVEMGCSNFKLDPAMMTPSNPPVTAVHEQERFAWRFYDIPMEHTVGFVCSDPAPSVPISDWIKMLLLGRGLSETADLIWMLAGAFLVMVVTQPNRVREDIRPGSTVWWFWRSWRTLAALCVGVLFLGFLLVLLLVAETQWVRGIMIGLVFAALVRLGLALIRARRGSHRVSAEPLL